MNSPSYIVKVKVNYRCLVCWFPLPKGLICSIFYNTKKFGWILLQKGAIINHLSRMYLFYILLFSLLIRSWILLWWYQKAYASFSHRIVVVLANLESLSCSICFLFPYIYFMFLQYKTFARYAIQFQLKSFQYAIWGS